jgi:hypothetical protein
MRKPFWPSLELPRKVCTGAIAAGDVGRVECCRDAALMPGLKTDARMVLRRWGVGRTTAVIHRIQDCSWVRGKGWVLRTSERGQTQEVGLNPSETSVGGRGGDGAGMASHPLIHGWPPLRRFGERNAKTFENWWQGGTCESNGNDAEFRSDGPEKGFRAGNLADPPRDWESHSSESFGRSSGKGSTRPLAPPPHFGWRDGRTRLSIPSGRAQSLSIPSGPVEACLIEWTDCQLR